LLAMTELGKRRVRFAASPVVVFFDPPDEHSTFTSWMIVVVAWLITCSFLCAPATPTHAHLPQFAMSKDERAHVLATFEAMCHAKNGNGTRDTVWSRRVYAPMFIHEDSLLSFRTAIERAFPDHAVAFDVVFAAADNAVPWHTDYDSLGPFDVSLRSIATDDFITVHTNLVAPEVGGSLRTVDSSALAAVHYVVNRLMNNFGSLAAVTELLSEALGVQTHDPTPGVGNAFNNLKPHDVTAGAGRISFVVRLVRKSVRLSGAQIRDAANGARSTRRIREFERLLPHLNGASEVPVCDFPWASVESGAGAA